MKMPDSTAHFEGNHSNQINNIRRMSAGSETNQASSPNISLDLSRGRPLSPSTRKYMEPRFGVDFCQVRLHTDKQAQENASQLQARAFTYGNNIWLGQGEQESDKHLIAHELTHVTQQRGIQSLARIQTQAGGAGGVQQVQYRLTEIVRRPLQAIRTRI